MPRMFTASLLAALALCALLDANPTSAQKGERWPKPDARIDCGPLAIDVYLSRTAHLFHLVDQISEWDNACHGQYRANMELTAEDEALLARHSEMRQTKRWGQGLEQTFYTPLELDAAIAAGLKADRIDRDQAEVLRAVLPHFAARADALLEEKRELMLRAFTSIDEERFTEVAKQLARFTGVKKLTVPAFPIASPAPGGGGMDGGRLRWEIFDERLSFSVLLHELTHGFFQQRNDLLEAVVERTPGLNMTLMGECFAYAVAPGMYPDGDGDPLAHNVAQDRCGNDRWQGQTGYGMQRMFGLAVRPMLVEAFEEGTTLEEFLPHVRTAFLAVNEVMMARELRAPRLHIAGPARDVVRERLLPSKYSMWMNRFNHASEEGYAQARDAAQPGDLLVVLIAGDDEDDAVPSAHLDLLPVALADVRKRIRARKTIAEEHMAGSLRVVLLAAPTTAALEKLVASTPLLDV